MRLLTQLFILLSTVHAHADVTNPEAKPPAQIRLSPLLASCIAGCEHTGTSKDCFAYCFSIAQTDEVKTELQALESTCGHLAGPALADCLSSRVLDGRDGRVRAAESPSRWNGCDPGRDN